jgi:hypothetical protein
MKRPLTRVSRLFALRLAGATLVIGLIAGCSGEESPAPSKPEASPTKVTKSAPAAKNDAKEAMEHAESKASQESTTSRQERAAAMIEKAIELPDFYPDDAPVYPGAAPGAAKKAPNGRISAVFTSSDPTEDVVAKLSSILSGSGWDTKAPNSMPNATFLQGSKGARAINVVLSQLDDGSSVPKTVIAVAVDP